MVFSDTTNYTGIIQAFERMTDQGYTAVSGDTTKLKEATNLANLKSSEIWHLIYKATGNWQYDDSNNADLPMATTNLVSGTARYALPSDALTIQRMEAMDSSGQWFVLKPMTKEQLNGIAVDEFLDTDSQPEFYSLVNGIVELFPAPNYNSTNGLKAYFDREAVDFATDDTTQTPGFASPYHEILPVMMAIDWYNVKQSQSGTLVKLEQKYLKLEKALKDFYSNRFKDFKPRIRRKLESYR